MVHHRKVQLPRSIRYMRRRRIWAVQRSRQVRPAERPTSPASQPARSTRRCGSRELTNHFNGLGSPRVTVVREYGGGRLRIERAEMPGREEALLVIRGFASHVPLSEALAFAKSCHWGRDSEANDMHWLTQWEHVDWTALGSLLHCEHFVRFVRRTVASDGFGQLRWYAANRETTEHADGFDGRRAGGDGEEVIGRARYLLRLGGAGYLSLRWRRRGGLAGRMAVLLRHGDLVLMDRAISGTKPNGRAYELTRSLRMTHRAGGLAAQHAPRLLHDGFDRRGVATLVGKGAVKPARSFCTLIWTSRVSRNAFVRFFHTKLVRCLLKQVPCCDDCTESWPVDPDELLDEVPNKPLLPWKPGLTLFDRQTR
eukprot:TRINITY_DN67805_c0_g1_i1.p1 TRINITY_DN67805_c0_g1~~TRINITY_DN67805_c0_g1_i1.p1  ORF type:complete len:368 (-),score=26.22 TRINITY_DN67805_c0_g1_i1:39-1142(-)